MQFNSIKYFIFLPAVTIVYYALPLKARKYWLLTASYFFYMNWNASYALLMLASTFITYLSGIAIGRANRLQDERKKALFRKLSVFLSFFINLSILFFFKYYGFTAELLGDFFQNVLHTAFTVPSLDVLLPVGISFYTFQALGYTVDVYRGDIEPRRNFASYALFVSYFPQLVAGPIERSTNLLHKLEQKHSFRYDNLRSGLMLIGWGLLKKVVIADRLAVLVNTVYNDVGSYEGIPLVVATIFFAFQIYCDFSAYSDIARGSARIMGVELMINFNAPYFARSVKEFWRRWHISLSTWFKDYLYIPLGGSRVPRIRRYFNLLLVFFVSGLWHGAGLTFVIWGILNGIYQIAGDLTGKVRKKIYTALHYDTDSTGHKTLQTVFTFILCCFAWIFFRANSIEDAIHVVQNIAAPNYWTLFDGTLFTLGLDEKDFRLAVLLIAGLLAADSFIQREKPAVSLMKQPLPVRWAVYLALMVLIVVCGFYGPGYDPQAFIYFQF